MVKALRCLRNGYAATRFWAEDLPVLRSGTISYEIFCPSLRPYMPERSTAKRASVSSNRELSAFNMSNADRAERGRFVSGFGEDRQTSAAFAREANSFGRNSIDEHRGSSPIYQGCLVHLLDLSHGIMLASPAASPRRES